MSKKKEPFLAQLIRKGETDAYAFKTIRAALKEEAIPIAIAWAENRFESEGVVQHQTTLYLKQGAKNWSI